MKGTASTKKSTGSSFYPSPDFFVKRSDTYYRSFNMDYRDGNVALFGGTRISAFRVFIGVEYPELNYLETDDGWYSIDGEDKKHCVMELGQVKSPQSNYRGCLGLKMGRNVFSN